MKKTAAWRLFAVTSLSLPAVLAGCKLLLGEPAGPTKKQQALIPKPLAIRTFTDTVQSTALVHAGSTIWEGTARGLLKWDAQKGTAQLVQASEGVPAGKVIALTLDAQSALWAVTAGGVAHQVLAPKPGWKSYPLPPVGEIAGITTTVDGAAWIGGDKGLVKLGKKGTWDPYLGSTGVTAVVGAGNDVWVGTKKNGLAHIIADKKGDRVEAFGAEQGVDVEKITQLTATATGVMAVGESRIGQRVLYFDGFRFWSYRPEGMETKKIQWLRRVGNDALVGSGHTVWTLKRAETPGAPAGIKLTSTSVVQPKPPLAGLAKNDPPVVFVLPEEKKEPSGPTSAFAPPPPTPKADAGKRKKGAAKDAKTAATATAKDAKTAATATAKDAKTAAAATAKDAKTAAAATAKDAKTAAAATAKDAKTAAAATAKDAKTAAAATAKDAKTAAAATAKDAKTAAAATAKDAKAAAAAVAPAAAPAAPASPASKDAKAAAPSPDGGAPVAAARPDGGAPPATPVAGVPAPPPAPPPPAPPPSAPGWEVAAWGPKLPDDTLLIGPDGPTLLIGRRYQGVAKVDTEGTLEYHQSDLALEGDKLWVSCEIASDCWISTGMPWAWHWDGNAVGVGPIDTEDGAKVVALLEPPNGGPLALSHGARDNGIRVQQLTGAKWNSLLLRDLQVPTGIPDITFATFSPDKKLWLGLRYLDKDGDASDFGTAEVDLSKDLVIFHRTVGVMSAQDPNLGSPLPNNITTAFFRNPTETWFGTRAGALRVRGADRKTFGEPEGVMNEAVRKFADGPDGRLWIATGHGVAGWDEKKWTYPGDDDPLRAKVISMVRDKFGWVWVGSSTGLYLCGPPDPNTAERYSLMKIDAKRGLADEKIIDLAIDRFSRVWVLTEKGVSLLER